VEAVKERADVKLHGCLTIAALEGLLEGDSIHLDRFVVQPDVLAGDDDRVFIQRLPQHVERIGESVARVRRVALRPEVRHQLIAAETFLARRREQCQQRQAMAVANAPRDGPTGTFQGNTAEQLQTVHDGPR